MLEDNFSDNLRQMGVVMKYEFKKYLRSKKIAILIVLMGIVLFLTTAGPYISGGGLSKDPVTLMSSYISVMGLLVILLSTLLVSGTIVSEFEERTALTLFTKPLRKWSIYLGKVFTACAVSFGFVLVYYAFTAAVCLIVTGTIRSSLLVSLGLAFMYIIGTAGLAIMLSSIMKRSSTATLLTFVLLLIILLIISGLLSSSSIDPWFMLDLSGAGASINDCLRNTDVQIWKYVAAMLAWGVVTGAAGYAAFRRREL